MKAAVVHEFGGPLVVEEVATPVPEQGRCWSEWRPPGCATPTSMPPTATGR